MCCLVLCGVVVMCLLLFGFEWLRLVLWVLVLVLVLMLCCVDLFGTDLLWFGFVLVCFDWLCLC